MSRHRLVRNLVEDDYYDDDYDDYDEDDYDDYDDTYAPPPKKAPAPKSTPAKQVVAKNFATKNPIPGKVQSTASVGVTKAPPGWGKPTTASPPNAAQKSPPKAASAASSGGVVKPPPGWGAPSLSSPPTTNNHTIEGNLPTATFPKSSSTICRSTTQKSNQGSAASSMSLYTPRPVPDFLRNTKSQLSMVILGHVDAGKSTLMGQVLVATGQVSKRDAAKQGSLAYLLDENESERERGVTMEIGTKTLRVPSHDIVILDAPGHHDFIPVMITGAANADVAILVVAAVTGEFEAGFTGGGQTKEHILLARGLGVTQIIVAVNKLDVEGWSEDRYYQIQKEVQDFLLKQQFKPKRIKFVPISGLTGENIMERKDTDLKSWYKGPTLLEAVDSFMPANRSIEKPPRFIVSDVYAEGRGVVTRGRVVQGYFEVGDRLVVLPVGDPVTVSRLEHLQAPSDDTDDPKRQSIGVAGDTIELVFNDIDIMRLSVGNILSLPNATPPLTNKAKARVIIMDKLTVPIIRGAQVIFHMHSLDVPAVMTKLIATLNGDGSVKKERPRAITSGVNAVVELTLSDKIVMESYSDCRSLGRFVLRRGGDTIAIGIIDETL
ncbi:translation elongation factor EF-1 subunit alpha [Nitzschia inconspicua]|uniref:Translation elongation factor EF-1 subunit alpha n=1 Tax=Nitzschia inconspicua TaxID=303405 RepID=A0A9K3LWZ4_9STRA|nr:translation elongation factor EF-1 subunit alpha [Nitzschia inconspicua]